MKKPVVILDCDGVLSDFATPALEVVRELGGVAPAASALKSFAIENLLEDPETRAEWWRRVTAPGFCAALDRYPGALAAVTRLRQFATVLCVTSPMYAPTWAYERVRWLQDMGFRTDEMFSGSGKQHIRGNFFADDRPEAVEAWNVANEGVGVVIAHSYNADTHLRRMTLERFTDFVVERLT